MLGLRPSYFNTTQTSLDVPYEDQCSLLIYLQSVRLCYWRALPRLQAAGTDACLSYPGAG